MANPIYASGDFKISWNGTSLGTGWGDDTFITVTPNGPIKETSIGADGNMSISKLADQGGVIEMTFMQTAEALAKIDEIAAAEMLVGEFYELPFAGFFLLEDPTGNNENFVAYNTVLVDNGSFSHQKVMGERTITWNCEKLILGNYSSIMATMSSYLKN